MDERANLEAPLLPRLGDVLQRLLADHRVGANPECRIPSREALVKLILDVGGRAGDALDEASRAGERAIRSLDDSHPSILPLA